jgi:DNA helicase-2/ATP-dependent DNA helicase PcrA
VLAGLDSYRALIDERSYLDYSAILEAAVEVMTNDLDLRKRLEDRVRHVIVDEYQDVNPIQEAIVWLLHDLGSTICVVGDDDQTVYQWRGSDVGNILTFEKRYPAVTQIPLEENFRSSEGVVATARAFIEQNAARLTKEMKPTGAQPYESGDIVALSFNDPEAEAEHIIGVIQSLRGVAFKRRRARGACPGPTWSCYCAALRRMASRSRGRFWRPASLSW